jgi:polyisoprenoid-binding protein YceI
MQALFLKCLILAATLPLLADELVLELDPGRTDIKFTLGAALHTVHGSFKLKRGTIRFDPATGKARGEFVVDVTSGESGNGSRDHHMHKDILESERYPEAVFTADRIDGSLAAQGASQLAVHGSLKVHGAEHEMTLRTEVQAQGDSLIATTHFIIPYVKWGMKNPSTFLLKVGDQVEIDVRATARRN